MGDANAKCSNEKSCAGSAPPGVRTNTHQRDKRQAEFNV